jgi:hypothetical protein
VNTQVGLSAGGQEFVGVQMTNTSLPATHPAQGTVTFGALLSPGRPRHLSAKKKK